MAEPDLEAQAQRALAFAEQRFLAGDVAGARHHARRALDLAPGLPGAEQALVAYDVHAAAAAGASLGLGALPSWYAVLFLPMPHHPLLQPSGGVVTHDDVKRQHRRLCLLVHPDKNTSAAADGAFKLVQAAYAALLPIHPPPPPRDEERIHFWQEAKHDEIAPPRPQRQPPPRQVAAAAAAPPRGPPEPPIWLPCCECQPPCVFARWYTTAAEGSRSSDSVEGCAVVDSSCTSLTSEAGGLCRRTGGRRAMNIS
ncbi:unnamed protein product [Urochloa humidicola]